MVSAMEVVLAVVAIEAGPLMVVRLAAAQLDASLSSGFGKAESLLSASALGCNAKSVMPLEKRLWPVREQQTRQQALLSA